MIQFLSDLFGGQMFPTRGQIFVRFVEQSFPSPSFLQIEWWILALALAVCLWWHGPARLWRRVLKRFDRIAASPWRACALVFCISIAGRIALHAVERFPEPQVHDEFSYLLGGDTLAHGRLANPPLPSWHHFEPFHVIMEPTYSTMYPPGFPMFLAMGQRLFGSPRYGVLICAAAAAASLCWMLLAVVPPGWALAGGLLAVVRMNWFSYFGDGYWGGASGMLGGCLLVGAAVRLVRRRQLRLRDGLTLAIALFLLMNTRPYEGAAFAVPLMLWVVWNLWRRRAVRILAAASVAFLVGAAWTGFYCERVTGRLMFPQSLQRKQWAMTPLLLGMKPHADRTYEFADQTGLYRDYELNELYLPQTTFAGYWQQVPDKLFREWYFYFSPGLTLLLIGFIPTFRSRKCRPLVLSSVCLAGALAIEPFLQPQYVAVGAGVLYLAMVNGLRWLWCAGRARKAWPRLMSAVIVAALLAAVVRLVVVPVDTWPPSWCSRQREMPAYSAIVTYVNQLPGRQLIFVRYDDRHFWGDSWVNNGADVASQKVIWARDTEPRESNLPLICAYPGRELLLLTPPDEGFTRPPSAGSWEHVPIDQFLKPYTSPAGSTCADRLVH